METIGFRREVRQLPTPEEKAKSLQRFIDLIRRLEKERDSAIFWFSELGPIDIQIPDPVERGDKPLSPLDEFKSMEFLEGHAVEILDYISSELENRGMSVKEALEQTIPCVVGMMRPLYEAVDPMIMGEHQRSLAIGEEYAKRLLREVGNTHAPKIVQKLVWAYPSHGFVIDRKEARAMNLPVAPLQREHDEALVEATLEMLDNEIPYCGFVPPAGRQAHRKPRKQQPHQTRAAAEERRAAVVA